MDQPDGESVAASFRPSHDFTANTLIANRARALLEAAAIAAHEIGRSRAARVWPKPLISAL
jgi:hypothetical protein